MRTFSLLHYFTIQSDYRPLIGLLKKCLVEMSPSIQRLTMRDLKYQFMLTYVPGKVPDSFSRPPTISAITTDSLEDNFREV